jgi:hypothetical protein
MKINKRYHLLDILRLLSIFAIVFFHCSEFIFYNDNIPVSNPSITYLITSFYARLIPFSGQSIIFLSFFLWGITKKKLIFRLYYIAVFLCGHLIINYSFSETIKDSLNWDIYPFLFASFLTVIQISKVTLKTNKVLLFISLLALFIPTHYFHFPIKYDLLADVIYGACHKGLSGAWPLLPWIALPIFSYTLGRFLFSYKKNLFTMAKIESIVWVFLLFISFSSIYFIYPWSIFDVPIGANFYCFMLNLHPTNFWSYFIPFLYLIRVSFLGTVNQYLTNCRFAIFVSSMYWNTHFALTYVCQIAVLFIFSYFSDYCLEQLFLYDLILIATVPVSELLSRSIHLIINKVST